jgi:hypothetical protein
MDLGIVMFMFGHGRGHEHGHENEHGYRHGLEHTAKKILEIGYLLFPVGLRTASENKTKS